MEPKDYFEANQDKIRQTAEFLCRDDASMIDEKFEELKKQYFNQEGTNHKEEIRINEQELNINYWLEKIRHEEKENFIIIAVCSKGSSIIYQTVGEQTYNNSIDFDEIDRKIVPLITLDGQRNIGFYIMHNHPYIYKATPSYADINTMRALKDEFERIEEETNRMKIICQLTMIDFGIVTEYDYWSAKQM